jgi:hypothetical protein
MVVSIAAPGLLLGPSILILADQIRAASPTARARVLSATASSATIRRASTSRPGPILPAASSTSPGLRATTPSSILRCAISPAVWSPASSSTLRRRTSTRPILPTATARGLRRTAAAASTTIWCAPRVRATPSPATLRPATVWPASSAMATISADTPIGRLWPAPDHCLEW